MIKFAILSCEKICKSFGKTCRIVSDIFLWMIFPVLSTDSPRNVAKTEALSSSKMNVGDGDKANIQQR